MSMFMFMFMIVRVRVRVHVRVRVRVSCPRDLKTKVKRNKGVAWGVSGPDPRDRSEFKNRTEVKRPIKPY